MTAFQEMLVILFTLIVFAIALLPYVTKLIERNIQGG